VRAEVDRLHDVVAKVDDAVDEFKPSLVQMFDLSTRHWCSNARNIIAYFAVDNARRLASDTGRRRRLRPR